MSLGKGWSKDDACYIAGGMLNIFLGLWVVLFVFSLIAPVFGGILSGNALIHYGSWIGIALLGKYQLKRYQKELLRTYDVIFFP
jgi:hypothetical protein